MFAEKSIKESRSMNLVKDVNECFVLKIYAEAT